MPVSRPEAGIPIEFPNGGFWPGLRIYVAELEVRYVCRAEIDS